MDFSMRGETHSNSPTTVEARKTEKKRKRASVWANSEAVCGNYDMFVTFVHIQCAFGRREGRPSRGRPNEIDCQVQRSNLE